MKIKYYIKNNERCPAEEFINELPLKARARTFKTFELLEKFGLEPGTHLKSITGVKGAWELRVKANKDIYRYYFRVREGDALIVHCLKKKSNKIPEKELKIIKKRLGEIK